MEERVFGFRVRGSWDEVVAHGERIARALRESDVDAIKYSTSDMSAHDVRWETSA